MSQRATVSPRRCLVPQAERLKHSDWNPYGLNWPAPHSKPSETPARAGRSMQAEDSPSPWREKLVRPFGLRDGVSGPYLQEVICSVPFRPSTFRTVTDCCCTLGFFPSDHDYHVFIFISLTQAPNEFDCGDKSKSLRLLLIITPRRPIELQRTLASVIASPLASDSITPIR